MRVAVLCGGSSPEANISRSSANEVSIALEKKHQVELIELDLHCLANLERFTPDVVFPVLHGIPGEDGTIQGLLRICGLPYVGSDTRSSAIALDKHATKLMWSDADLPVLPTKMVSRDDLSCASLGVNAGDYPLGLVIKPNNSGSALGVEIIRDLSDYPDALRQALKHHDSLLIEPFVCGREITVGILDLIESDAIALPVIDILSAPGEWYDSVNRYAAGKSKHVIPPQNMKSSTMRLLEQYALIAHQSLNCADLSRVDFIVDHEDEICLLEINTLPGMTPTSLYPDAARAAGISFDDLVDKLVVSGYDRGVR